MFIKDTHEYIYSNGVYNNPSTKGENQGRGYSIHPRIIQLTKTQTFEADDIDSARPLNEIKISELRVYTDIKVLRDIYQKNILNVEQLLSITEKDFKRIFRYSKFKKEIRDLISLMNCKFNGIFDSNKLARNVDLHPEEFCSNMCLSKELSNALIEYVKYHNSHYNFYTDYHTFEEVLILAQEVEDGRSDFILPPMLKNEFVIKARIFPNYTMSGRGR